MAKRDQQPAFNPDDAIRAFQKLSPETRMALVGLFAVAVIVFGVYYFFFADRAGDQPGTTAGPPGTYLFCTWNVENFFDDQDDPLNRDDEEDWFGNDPQAFREKAEHLATALLLMNDGKGPDILAVCEVESERCMNFLRDTVNARLEAAGKADAKYQHVLFEEDRTGRRFAPGILTRLPVDRNRTRQLKASQAMQRILLGHVRVNGHDLVIIAAHWTSRVGAGDTAEKRMRYAQKCYGETREIVTANPDADVIVCGDFNDEFQDISLQEGLRARADPQTVIAAPLHEPLLLNLCAGLPAGSDPPGTITYNRKWQLFDHICVTRGLLDSKGWSVEKDGASIFGPRELRTGNKYREPFPFGREKSQVERGYSDHLPVIARLRVEGSAEAAK